MRADLARVDAKILKGMAETDEKGGENMMRFERTWARNLAKKNEEGNSCQ